MVMKEVKKTNASSISSKSKKVTELLNDFSNVAPADT